MGLIVEGISQVVNDFETEPRSAEELAGPDAGGEGLDSVEAEMFVQLDGGTVFRGYREGEFAEFHGTEGFGGSLHEHAAEAVTLVAREDADLRGVADAGGDFAGEDRGDEIVAAWLVKNEGGARNKLAAARKKEDVFQRMLADAPAFVSWTFCRSSNMNWRV
jgi:hypothetical protein